MIENDLSPRIAKFSKEGYQKMLTIKSVKYNTIIISKLQWETQFIAIIRNKNGQTKSKSGGTFAVINLSLFNSSFDSCILLPTIIELRII